MMLHLAQVQQRSIPERPTLKLLAAQTTDEVWITLGGEVLLPPEQVVNVFPGQLVLADLSENCEVLSMYDARDWVVELVQRYLSHGITPEFLHQETERAEQWRQILTLQSQELDRRALEMEARREQIQELEENLKQQRRDLDLQREQLQNQERLLWEERQRLHAMQQEFELCQQDDRDPPT
jgi:hypothetical protein